MDETTARQVDVLYRASVETGKRLDELVRVHEMQHQAVSAIHDLAVYEHALALCTRFEWRTKAECDELAAEDHMERGAYERGWR